MPAGEVKIKGAIDLSYKLNRQASIIARNVKLMALIGAFMKKTILARTAKGLDVRGKRFKAYSPSYRMIREKAGLSSSIVNLFFTGSMLSALTYTVKPGSALLYVRDTKDKKGISNYLKAEYNQETREFMGINKKESMQIQALVHAYVAKTLRK